MSLLSAHCAHQIASPPHPGSSRTAIRTSGLGRGGMPAWTGGQGPPGHLLGNRPFGPPGSPSPQHYGPPHTRNTTNTIKVHQMVEEPDLDVEAAEVAQEYWQAATAGVAGQAGDIEQVDRGPAAQLLQLLLPCLQPALQSRAHNDVALRLVADKLSRLTLQRLDVQEAEVLALFRGLLSRSYDTEPEERQARKALTTAMWTGFAAARVAQRMDASVTGPMMSGLQQYRQQYRAATMSALTHLLHEAHTQGGMLGAKVVLLRSLLKGSVSGTILRHPALLQVDAGTLQSAAQQQAAQEQSPSASTHALDQVVLDQLLGSSRPDEQQQLVAST